ncbi:MAG: DeoR/GlpR transcriptional regulator [Rhodobacteraceae bacterium]|nr:DeoR/GlpR transcriptional regulator [Paracoccaceae bacterium]
MVKDKKSRSNHREVEVLDALRRLGGAARNANLADLLGVSEETIRRTTKALAKSDLVRRVHGGSYLVDAEAGAGVFSRLGLRSGEKSRIAMTAANLIPDGACVFLDVGSTSTFVAQSLSGRTNLTIVTNSLNVAQSLANSEGCRVFLAGGELRRTEWGAFGADTIRFLESFRFDVAILSVDGINIEGGFLLTGHEEAAVSRAVVSRTVLTIVVADHQKFNKQAPMVLCAPQSVDVVVTDQPLSADFAQCFQAWGVALVNATDPKVDAIPDREIA